MRLIIVTIDHINALLKNEDQDVCAPRRVSSFNFMNMLIHVEYLLELSKILPNKGGIIACTHRAGILVIVNFLVWLRCQLIMNFLFVGILMLE